MSTDAAPAFARAAQARAAIADIVAAVRSGEVGLAGAFERADADPLTGRCFAVKVFEAVPGIGKVRARRTMEAVGLDEGVWLAQVGPAERAAVIAAFDQDEDKSEDE